MSQLFKRISAAAVLQFLVWGVLLTLALTLPLTKASLDYQYERGMLRSDLQARAFLVGNRISANPQFWRFEEFRLLEALEKDLLPEGRGDRRAVVDDKERTIVETLKRGAVAPPVLRERVDLFENGQLAGYLVIERSMRLLVIEAAVLGGASLLLAVCIAVLLTKLPLRQLRSMEDELAHKAYHDDLTGLLNRDAFRRLLSDAVARAGRERRRLAVLFIDLDRFKSINDSMGHDAGDEALRAVAERLRHCVRANDVLARLSGDEFAIVVDSPTVSAKQLGESVLTRFQQNFEVAGRPWRLGCCIGVAVTPDHGDDPDRLLACADTAMLVAKNSGRSACRVYEESMEESVLRRVNLEDELRGALERNEFRLHYQPLVDLRTGALRGVEALLRWQHPTRGLVSPLEFIPVLESMGLIHAVGQWVLDESCAQLCRWQAQGLLALQVSVNVSPLQFSRQLDFVDAVRGALQRTGLPPAQLQLELTESTLMTDSAQSQRLLNELRHHGVELAIDDFGTGYSSLAYLRSFPVSVLKIDRSFVRDMMSSDANASIVKAIVQMAQGLGLSVTAEGIETAEQLAALKALGCSTGQGFGLGRPAPAEVIEGLLRGAAAQQAGQAPASGPPVAAPAVDPVSA